MISSSLMVVNWNKELLSKCSFLCTNKAKKSCRLLYIKNASALSQTKAGAFSFWVSVMLFKTIQREERFVPWGTARRYRQSWRYLIRLLSAGILKRGCTRARKEYSAVLVKPVRCIVLYWIGLRPRFAASFGGSPRVAASCREKAFSQETGQICGFLPKPHARGKQSFLFCPGALIWCISHTHGGRLAEMTPQNRDSCSTTHKGAYSQNGNMVKTALTRPAIQEHVKAIGLFCPIGGRVRGEAIQKLRGILSLSVPHTRAGNGAGTF